MRSSTQTDARATLTANMQTIGWAATQGPNRGKATTHTNGAATAAAGVRDRSQRHQLTLGARAPRV
jgi:hypothetical protein